MEILWWPYFKNISKRNSQATESISTLFLTNIVDVSVPCEEDEDVLPLRNIGADVCLSILHPRESVEENNRNCNVKIILNTMFRIEFKVKEEKKTFFLQKCERSLIYLYLVAGEVAVV